MKFSIRLWALLSLWLSLLAAGPLRAQTGTTIQGTILSGGQIRKYQVYVPKSYQPGKAFPLVFQLHPHCFVGSQMESFTNYSLVADSANFLLVSPTGTWDSGGNCWTWNTWVGNYTVDDTGFLSDLLTSLQAQYSVDAQRVYAMGLSNGGFMSYMLAAQLSNRIAAIGSVAGSMIGELLTSCAPSRRPVPVIEIHGTDDQTVPIAGGAPYYFASVPDVMAKWAQLNGCAPNPVLVKTNTTTQVRRSVWSPSPGDSTVVLYEVIGGSHEQPFNQWGRDNAYGEMWRFLRKYSLPTTPTSTAPGANLALNKPVSSSSLEHNTLPSSNAVDGNDGATRWSSAWSDNEWLYVDLGASYTINHVKLTWHTNYGKAYNIEVSDDAINWTIIKPVTDNDKLVNDLTGFTGTGRYVRMNGKARGTSASYSLYEFEVYGTPPNLALNKPVTVSSVENANLLGSAAVDGNSTTTRWGSDFTDAQWLYVDLGASYNINEVKLSWERDYGKNYTIDVSDDASTWTTIQPVPSNTGLINDLTNLSGTGRYVRMSGKASGPWGGYSLYEFEVYGTPAATPNLALGHPVKVSSFESSDLPGKAAVDGTLTTRWSSATTDNEWLSVDLGARYNLNRVKLSWQDAYGKDYTIEVSDDEQSWTSIKSVTNNANTFNDLTGLSGTGRYVRMNGTARGTTWGYSLLEFEVYGTPVFSITADGVYELEPQSAIGQRLDVIGMNTANEALVALYARSGEANQQWKFFDKGNNSYELEPQHAVGKRLDVYNLSASENATVQTYTSNGGANQRWKATAIGNGIYEFEPQCAIGKRLDIGVANGVTRAVSKTATGVGSQRWRLYPVASAAQRVLAQPALAAETGALSVFPNPTTATVTLSGVAAFPATAELYDAQGARLSSVQLTQAGDALNVSQLATGLYTIRVSSPQTVQTVRLQKN